MITIKSKRDGFRRCGMPHPANETEYADDRFTPEQLAILKADPMLLVEVIKTEPGQPNAKDTIALVKAAADLAALNELATGEERKSVLAVIDARRKELTPGGDE